MGNQRWQNRCEGIIASSRRYRKDRRQFFCAGPGFPGGTRPTSFGRPETRRKILREFPWEYSDAQVGRWSRISRFTSAGESSRTMLRRFASIRGTIHNASQSPHSSPLIEASLCRASPGTGSSRLHPQGRPNSGREPPDIVIRIQPQQTPRKQLRGEQHPVAFNQLEPPDAPHTERASPVMPHDGMRRIDAFPPRDARPQSQFRVIPLE